MKRSSTSKVPRNNGSASKTVRGGRKPAAPAAMPRAGKSPSSN